MGRSEELVKVDVAIPAPAWESLEPLVRSRSLAAQLRQRLRMSLSLQARQFEELARRAHESRRAGPTHRYSPELLADDVARLDGRLSDLEIRLSRAAFLQFLVTSIAGES